MSSTEQRLSTLYEYVDDTEDYIEIDQDSHRNQLIQLDLLATAGMISMSFVTVPTTRTPRPAAPSPLLPAHIFLPMVRRRRRIYCSHS